MKAKRLLLMLMAAMLLVGSCLAEGATTKDLSYETALEIARQAIFDKYATPAEELDAMGVYPNFYAAEPGYSADWRFYFTPMKGDVNKDHAATGEGEYRVYINSPSGEVTFCNWYIDDFWPYAQRTWDAGKQDVVDEMARKAGFFSQPAEQQEHFLALLEGAGYDVSAIRSHETIWEDTVFRLDLNFGDPSRAVDPAADPRIATAWQAIEDKFGLDGELMRKYAYISFYSPLETGTQDVYIAYSYEREWAMQGSEELPLCAAILFSRATNLGYYLVQLDQETGEVLSVTHRDRDQSADRGDPTKLLGRPQWNAADLVEFDAAYEHFCDAMRELGEENWWTAEGELLRDELMRELGGDPELYNSRREQATDIGLAAGEAIAREAARQVSGLAAEDFDAMYTAQETSYLPERGAYEYWFMADIRVTEDVYWVVIDAATGEVLEAKLSHGNG